MPVPVPQLPTPTNPYPTGYEQVAPYTEPTVPTILDEIGILREAATNCPVCLRSGQPIEDEEFQVVVKDPFDDVIFIGPYDMKGWPYVKLCVSCRKACMVDDETQIKHYGGGSWLCTDCRSKVVICPICNSVAANIVSVNDEKMCKECFERKYLICSYTGEIVERGPATSFTTLETRMYEQLFEDYPQRYLSREGFRRLKRQYTPAELGECKNCGSILRLNKWGFCATCVEEGAVYICEGCKCQFISSSSTDDEVKHHVRARHFCTKCLSKKVVCQVSKKLIAKRKAIKLRTKLEDKYVARVERQSTALKKSKECRLCGRVTLDKLRRYKRDYYCFSCHCSMSHCGGCDKPHLGESFCRRSSCTNINDYGYRPTPFFHFTRDEVKKDNNQHSMLFMGFELEVSYKTLSSMDKAIKKIYERFDATEIYLKSDSSINGEGFEIVSHPYTLDAMKKLPASKFFSEGIREDNKTGCGMHVHVNRSFFSGNMHLYRFISFINEEETFMKKLAGRYSVGYSKKHESVSRDIKVGKNNPGRTRRYSFVNLTNKNTIEVRIFKGATKFSEFKARTEFVDALARWSKDSSLKAGLKEFKDYVLSRKERYEKLIEYMSLS